MNRRIITRPDFDGVVCAVLLKEVFGNTAPIVWTQPSEVQRGAFTVTAHDIVANLPLSGDVELWFDHHVSNQTDHPYEGIFRIAPSAAGLVYEYFKDKLHPRFDELVHQADKIDSAQLTLDEILHPENYPYVLLSMTVFTRQDSDYSYCDLLVERLFKDTISDLLNHPIVRQRCDTAVANNKLYETLLKQYTSVTSKVSISDFRNLASIPDGNRFLVYCLFPEAVVNAKLYCDAPYVVVKLGHSIVNRGCNVNLGRLLSNYDGGGHKGAGACRLAPDQADMHIRDIINTLIENRPDE
jgi:hypothetical protein